MLISSKYAKMILATVVAVVTALAAALGTNGQSLGDFTLQDWLTVLLSILGTGAVTAWATNVPGIAGGIIKAVLATLGAFVTGVVTGYADGVLTQADLLVAISAAVVALAAVYEQPNVGEPAVAPPR